MFTFVLDYEGFYDSYKKKIIVQEYAAVSLDNNFSYHNCLKTTTKKYFTLCVKSLITYLIV